MCSDICIRLVLSDFDQNIERSKEDLQFLIYFKIQQYLDKTSISIFFNPLPDMPLFYSSNSAANKDIMLKTRKNGDKVI